MIGIDRKALHLKILLSYVQRLISLPFSQYNGFPKPILVTNQEVDDNKDRVSNLEHSRVRNNFIPKEIVDSR